KVAIVSRKQQSTRNRILGVKTFRDSQIVFYDTPGFLKKKEKVDSSVSEADIVLLLVDAAQAVSDSNFMTKLTESLKLRKISSPSCIALNKVDLVDKVKLLPLIASLQEEFSEDEVLFIPISAQTGDGVEYLLEMLSEKLPKGPWYFPEGMLSDQSEQFLAAEIIREAIFERVHQELPYSSAVQITGWEEKGKHLHIHANILIEKDSQKGIIIGKKGAALKAIGKAARIALEKRFSVPVYLELFVKVEAEWTRSRRGMSRAGYESVK
ncbi:UNVERIFIED_CONTAM: hypothetical protein GTU68_045230, partial [Idotea baltica]|nr:hypothetical protein [Idotea baltica]